MDNSNELLPIVDNNGNVIGKVARGIAHNGTKTLHPVVHLHIFSRHGDIYLQKRPAWKDVQPGKWDTAVGGHIDYGEDIDSALKREIYEELGIVKCECEFVDRYIYESNVEKEMIYAYKTVLTEENIKPNSQELAGGRFWSMKEISENIGKNVFTPNFEYEYNNIFQLQTNSQTKNNTIFR